MAKKSTSKKTEKVKEGEKVQPVDEKMVELEGEMKALEAKLQDEKDRYHRLYAEFDNFRRRTAKEKLELISRASENICTDLLPVLDDFERAESNSSEEMDTKSVLEGVNLVHLKLKKTLESQGLKPIESAVGKALDTDFHEAITMIPAPNDELKGKIIDEVEKGYMLNDKVIRFSKVVVGQ
jgi:molecular chaperone GrpE